MTDTDSTRREFRRVIRLLDLHRRTLDEAEASSDVLETYDKVLRHLSRLPQSTIEKILLENTRTTAAKDREEQINRASGYSLKEVEKIISRENISRSQLEAIAIGRFSVPRGSMRSMGNIDRLREKLETFVQNEKTHSAITKLARDS